MRRKLGADCVPIKQHRKHYLVVQRSLHFQLRLFLDLLTSWLHPGRLIYGDPSDIYCRTLPSKLLAQAGFDRI